jgi:histidyl-tRNA synthetase
LEELNLFPANLESTTRALFFNMGEAESLFALQQVQHLRANGIACELFHENAKMDKQFKYADKKFIPFAVIIGGKEMENKEAVVKNLQTSEQQIIPLIRLTDFFKEINR